VGGNGSFRVFWSEIFVFFLAFCPDSIHNNLTAAELQTGGLRQKRPKVFLGEAKNEKTNPFNGNSFYGTFFVSHGAGLSASG
jgi:hypothetical protein